MLSLDKINQAVEAAYGSLERPRFDFVTKAKKEQPYARLVKKLELEFEISETTDLNDDVAFCYHCTSRNDKQTISIRLSMIGRYGFVSEDGFLPLDHPTNVELKRAFNLLKGEQIQLLSRRILEASVPLKFEDGKETFVFNALFSPIEELPWRSPRE